MGEDQEEYMGSKKDLADIRRVLFGSIFGIPFRLFVRVIKLLGFVFSFANRAVTPCTAIQRCQNC